jgi:hypothetical protein
VDEIGGAWKQGPKFEIRTGWLGRVQREYKKHSAPSTFGDVMGACISRAKEVIEFVHSCIGDESGRTMVTSSGSCH